MTDPQYPSLIEGFLDFLQRSPTPFHATANAVAELQQAGFQLLREADSWQLTPGGRYIVTRNDSALLAFTLPAADHSVVESGFHLAGAHTDSPCLKVKPSPELERFGCLQLGVEVYGGVLQNPWFDRDLSMAGRVTFVDGAGRLGSTLVDFARPVALIPSLAIHLDRGVNESRAINAQLHLPPVLTLAGEHAPVRFRDLLLAEVKQAQPTSPATEILDYEIAFYDTQPPARTGLNGELISGARLDNLLSCYAGLQALLQANGARPAMLVLTDHEEVGSASVPGAAGTLMQAVLRRIAGSDEGYARMLARSFLISCDNAHALHPNYPERHDSPSGPLINQGPVIKINANQRYATSSETAGRFRQLCRAVGVPVQSFVVRSDMGCGSTIGPIAATELGVETVDVGVPQWAMHSIRETAGARDIDYLFRVLRHFFSR